MRTHQIIKDLEIELDAIKENGVEQIEVKNFDAYIKSLKEGIEEIDQIDELQTQRDLAFYTAKRASKIESYKAKVQRFLDGFNSVISLGQSALKSCTIINGGAAVALLAFIGNIVLKRNTTALTGGIADALFAFGVGLLLASLATGSTYLAQYLYESKKRPVAKTFHAITILLVVLSYASFLTGSWIAYDSIKDQASIEPANNSTATATPKEDQAVISEIPAPRP